MWKFLLLKQHCWGMVQLLQLEGCSANYLLVKDRAIISATQEVVGCHWRHRFYSFSHQIYSLQSGEDLLADPHLELVVPLPPTPPPPPPLAPMLLNCSKQAITSNQPGFWEQGEGGVMEDWSWRRVTNIIMLHGSIGLIQKDMCLTVNTTNAATHNTAFCKSSVNASTLHSCSYFKQG